MPRNHRVTPRVHLLIAISMLTTGLAIVAAATGGLASEPSVARTPPDHDDRTGPRDLLLEGNLTHADTGDPIEDATLDIANVWTREENDHTIHDRDRFTVQTGEGGHYAVNVSAGDVRLDVDDANYQRVHASFEIDDDLALDVPMRPVNESLATLAGQVTDTEDAPLSDARVSVRPQPTCRGDVCYAEAHASEDAGDREHVVEVDDETIVIRYDPRNDPYAHARTDEEGRYAVRVPPGDYVVEARASDHLEERREIELAKGEDATLDVALTPVPPDSVTIQGTVRDAETGEPIPYADVQVRNEVWGAWNHTRADEEGRFTLGTKPGHAIVTARADEHYWVPCEDNGGREDAGQTASTSRAYPEKACDGDRERAKAYDPRVTTISANESETVDLSPQLASAPGPDATFSGWVVNATSQEGIPNAFVLFRNERTNEWGRVETGEDGSFTIDVRAGYYTIRTQADGYYTAAENREIASGEEQQIALEVEPGQPRRGHCCVVYETSASASADAAREEDAGGDGTSTSASTGAPAPGGGGDGPQAFEGGQGDLGPYPGKLHSYEGDAGQNAAPLPHVLGTLAMIALGAAALTVWRPRER